MRSIDKGEEGGGKAGDEVERNNKRAGEIDIEGKKDRTDQDWSSGAKREEQEKKGELERGLSWRRRNNLGGEEKNGR